MTEISEFCSARQSLVRAAMNQLNLSARAFHRVLKLARTIADLAVSEAIQAMRAAPRITQSMTSLVAAHSAAKANGLTHARVGMSNTAPKSATPDRTGWKLVPA